MVVLNLLTGPPLFKSAVLAMGEGVGVEGRSKGHPHDLPIVLGDASEVQSPLPTSSHRGRSSAPEQLSAITASSRTLSS